MLSFRKKNKPAKLALATVNNNALATTQLNYSNAFLRYFDSHKNSSTLSQGWDWKQVLTEFKTAAEQYYAIIDFASGLENYKEVIIDIIKHHPLFIHHEKPDDIYVPKDELGIPVSFIYELYELGVITGKHLLNKSTKEDKSTNSKHNFLTTAQHVTFFIIQCIKANNQQAAFLDKMLAEQDSTLAQKQEQAKQLLAKYLERINYSIKKIKELNQVITDSGLNSEKYQNEIAPITAELQALESLKTKLTHRFGYMTACELFLTQARQAAENNTPWNWQRYFDSFKEKLYRYIESIDNIAQGKSELIYLCAMIRALPNIKIEIANGLIITEVGENKTQLEPDLNLVSIQLICSFYELVFHTGSKLVLHFSNKFQSTYSTDIIDILNIMAEKIANFVAESTQYASHLFNQGEYQGCQVYSAHALALIRACNHEIQTSPIDNRKINRRSLVTFEIMLKDLNEKSQSKMAKQQETISAIQDLFITEPPYKTETPDQTAKETDKANTQAKKKRTHTGPRKRHRKKYNPENNLAQLSEIITENKAIENEKAEESSNRSATASPVSSVQSLTLSDGITTDESVNDDGPDGEIESLLNDSHTSNETETTESTISRLNIALDTPDEPEDFTKSLSKHLSIEKNPIDVIADLAAKVKPNYCNIEPRCLKNNDGTTSKFASVIQKLSELFKQYDCEGFLYGSAIYKVNPGDLDILIPNQIMGAEKIKNIAQHIKKLGGKITAKYDKNKDGWYTYKITYQSVDIDFISSPLTVERHAQKLDFTVGAMHYDIQQQKMRQPASENYLKHLRQEKLATVSDALGMIQNDPTIIFRTVRAQTTTGFKISDALQIAITNALKNSKLFDKVNLDKLCFEIEKLFFSDNHLEIFSLLSQKKNDETPSIFERLFSTLKTLSIRESERKLSEQGLPEKSKEYSAGEFNQLSPSLPNLFIILIKRDPAIVLRIVNSKANQVAIPEAASNMAKNALRNTETFSKPHMLHKLCLEMEKLFCHGDTTIAFDILGKQLGVSFQFFHIISRTIANQFFQQPGQATQSIPFFRNNSQALTLTLSLMIQRDPTLILRALTKKITANTEINVSSELKNAITDNFSKANLFSFIPTDKISQFIHNTLYTESRDTLLATLENDLYLFDAFFVALNTHATMNYLPDPNILDMLAAMIKHDPKVLLRFIYTQTASQGVISRALYAAITQCFAAENLFSRIDPDQLYKHLAPLLCCGNASAALNTMIYQLNIFNLLFTKLDQLTEQQKDFTLSLVWQLASANDHAYANCGAGHFSFSLFYFAIHYFFLPKIFIAYQDESTNTLMASCCINPENTFKAADSPQDTEQPRAPFHWSEQPVKTNIFAPKNFKGPVVLSFTPPISSPEISLSEEKPRPEALHFQITYLQYLVDQLKQVGQNAQTPFSDNNPNVFCKLVNQPNSSTSHKPPSNGSPKPG